MFYVNVQMILKMSLSNSRIFKNKIYKNILPLLPETEKPHLKSQNGCYQQYYSDAASRIFQVHHSVFD